MRDQQIHGSSIIERVAHDEMASTLCIWFRGTGGYVYYDVPRAIYDALCRAASHGGYFSAHIKGRYRCARDPGRRRGGPKA